MIQIPSRGPANIINMKLRMAILILVLGFCYAKDPVRVPGDLNVEDLLNATEVIMPAETTLACDSAEISTFYADSTTASYINADTVYVSKLLATDSSILFNGKVNITGTITYSSKIQIGLHKGKGNTQNVMLLQVEKNMWEEVDLIFVEDKTVVQLPKHDFVQVVANCHCEHGQALLEVDGKVEWMQSCQGTMHIQSVIEHQNPQASLNFKGCSEVGAVWVNIK